MNFPEFNKVSMEAGERTAGEVSLENEKILGASMMTIGGKYLSKREARSMQP